MTKNIFITSTGSGEFVIPDDFGYLDSVATIGCGSQRAGTGWQGTSIYYWCAGAGGAYAQTNANSVESYLYPGKICYYHVPAAGTQSYYEAYETGDGVYVPSADCWFNINANTYPLEKSEGVRAQNANSWTSTVTDPAYVYPTGGSSDRCVGDVTYSGGAGAPMTGGGEGGRGGGGGKGGGAAGPGGAGAPYNLGGYAGGSNSSFNGTNGDADSPNGTDAPTGEGGSGGNGYLHEVVEDVIVAGGGPGQEETIQVVTDVVLGNGGNGAMLNVWWGSVYPDTTGIGTWAGPGGGGGTGAITVPYAGLGLGSGSYGYGGGEGSGASSKDGYSAMNAGQGLIVFSYTPRIVVESGISIPGGAIFD